MSGSAVGNHLRRLRFEHGELSQEALARRVGVTRQTIIAIEGGRYAPSLELAMRLAREFGLGVDEVFFWNESPDQTA
ncbi:helix-turn-helix transcriptional regulator [Pseudomarimonas salicorniae]|uniref:Helix-turn-helix transcriptional regulator n=1 Tax=Pseudomarimonas salicorniae TaxID=2933270 RepID=A0ABT0GE99_9GAMM|nr:helix-turn-helix transcriptional regulator [Lysobacter sp. CAU 1642]MCK7592866.1 helix-turn-helix transcriptional regulator [Lysobacter sp. CAU 1642]